MVCVCHNILWKGQCCLMSQPSVSEDARPPRSLWRNRDFLLLWSGQSISTVGTGVSQFALPLLALAPSAALEVAGYGLANLLWPLYGVTLVSYRLEQTPDALQGRVNSAFRFLSYGAEPPGAALGGALLAALGPRPVLGLIAAGLALCALVSLGAARRGCWLTRW